jgi:hypothetical protein
MFAAAAPSRAAVDLDDERDPESAAWVSWQAGIGPSVRECRVNDRGSLRCDLDEEVEDVECYVVDPPRERRLRVNVRATAFACEVLPKTSDLSRSWRIVVVGKSGGVTRWSAEGRTVQQTRSAYLHEMRADRAVNPWVRAYEVGLGGGTFLGTGGFPFGTFYSRARLSDDFRGSVSVERGVGTAGASGFGSDWRATVTYRYWVTEGGSELGAFLTYHRRARGGVAFETPRLGLSMDLPLFKTVGVAGEMSAGWPSLASPQRLRADIEAEGRLRWGPWGSLQAEFVTAFRNEDWIQGGEPWLARYLVIRAGLAWRRDFD